MGSKRNLCESSSCGVYELQNDSVRIFGLIARFSLETMHAHILTHEKISPGILNTVACELLQSGIQRKPVTLLHQCPLFDKSIESLKGDPLASCQDEQGFLHTVYALNTASFSLPPGQLLLADGHHRFSALQHLSRANAELSPYLLGAVFSSDAFCLLHLQVTLDFSFFSGKELFAHLSDHFHVRKIEIGAEEQEALIVHVPSAMYGLEPKEKHAFCPSEILQDLFLSECLDIYPFWDHPQVLQLKYVHRFDYDSVLDHASQARVYCRAATISEIFARAKKRSLFQHHSTHFYPYLIENLVPAALGFEDKTLSSVS